jgi:flagellar basal-body rod protein FlgB
MNDLTTSTLHAAMRGLAARQRTIADNIANLETPGFRAGRVSFEANLREAVATRSTNATAGTEITSSRSLGPTLPNGNNVNLDAETLSMVDTNLRYQLTTEALNAKYRLLRTAMTSR